MIFSATVPNFIAKIASESMDKPVLIDLVGEDTNQLPATLVSKAIISPNFEHKIQHIKQFVQQNRDKKVMIFTETKSDAQRFVELDFAKFLPIHGDLDQRAREKALGRFREEGSKYILVGTDVAARGLDVDDIDVVMHLQCRQVDSFVHRSGRTARKGKDGLNILFIGK